MQLSLRTKGAPLGNQNGAKPNRIVSDMLKRIAAQNPQKLRAACEALFEKAKTDSVAFRELADRLEGKVSSTDSSPVRVYIVKDTDQLPPLDVTPQVVTDQDVTE